MRGLIDCALCGRRFQPRSNNQRFCCPAHTYAAKIATNRTRYGRDHRKLRAALKGHVEAGLDFCGRCGERIEKGEPWDLDHRDDGSGYLGASHQFLQQAVTGVGEPARGCVEAEAGTLGLSLCEWCGVGFERQVGRGRPRKLCAVCAPSRSRRPYVPVGVHTLVCVECGGSFTAMRSNAFVCSRRCKDARYQRLNPAVYAAAQRRKRLRRLGRLRGEA